MPVIVPLTFSGTPAALATRNVASLALKTRLATWLFEKLRSTLPPPRVDRLVATIAAGPDEFCEIVPPLVSVTLGAVSAAFKVIVGEVSDTEPFDETAELRTIDCVVNVGVVNAVSDALFSVTGALMKTLALLRDSTAVGSPPEATVIGAVTSRLNCEARVTLPVASSVATLAAVIWLLAPGAPAASVLPTRSSPVGGVPSTSATRPMVRFCGSSNRLPVVPRGARRSAAPSKASDPLPETSIRPPSPPSAPPRAFACPE